MFAVFMRAGKGHNRRLTEDSASSQMPLVCHAGPELEEEVKNADVAGLTFKETESEVGMHSLLPPGVAHSPAMTTCYRVMDLHRHDDTDKALQNLTATVCLPSR